MFDSFALTRSGYDLGNLVHGDTQMYVEHWPANFKEKSFKVKRAVCTLVSYHWRRAAKQLKSYHTQTVQYNFNSAYGFFNNFSQ